MARKKLSEILRENAQSKEEQLQQVARINQAFEENAVNLPPPQRRTPPTIGQQAGYVGGRFISGVGSSVLDTIGALPQSMAVGYNRAAQQSAGEQSVAQKRYNTLKNLAKYTAIDPMGRLLYNATLGREDYINNYKNLAEQMQSNYDKADNVFGKIGAVLGGATSNAIQENNPIINKIYDTTQLAGQLQGQKVAEQKRDQLLELDKKIHEPTDKLNEKLDEDREDYGKITQFLGDVSSTIGYMTPSIVLSAMGGGSGMSESATKAIGLTQMGLASKGQSTREGLKQGLDLETAERKGIATGTAEAGSELMFDGLKAFKKFRKSGFENAARKWIEDTVENKIKSALGQKLTKSVGNWLLDVTGEGIEEIATDIYGTWLENATTDPNKQYTLEDAANTFLMTMATTTGLNLGTTALNNIQNRQQNVQPGNNVANMEAKQVESTQQLPTQQTDNRNVAINEINNSRINTQEKQQMIDILNNMDDVSSEDLAVIRETIQNANKANMLLTNETYKESQQRRQSYAKYKNDTSDYDSTVVNNILATIPANRNGNRTVSQWLKAADNIGQQISNLSNEEIEKIAYKSWFDLQPTKNITQYDNQAKQKVGFQKLTSDEWVNTINNAVNQARESQPVQQATPPTQQSTVTPSDDLISSARKYNLKYQDSNLNQVQNVFKNKGIDSRFDASKFTDNKTGAMWQLTRDQDGNVRREIILNPNADEKTVIQEMAIHELTHDIVAKNTDTSTKLYNEVRDWLAKDSEYQKQLEQLKSVYGENVVEEEAIAKTLQTKFGNQESIDNLVNYNPSMARIIYDWIVDKLNKITGGRIEKLYWEDVKNKFERAYSEQGEYTKNNTTRYSKDLKERQNSIIQNSNPLNQELGEHTWINNINDIKTYKEAIDDFGGIDNITPDYTAQDVQKALDTGKITVYSSYPIEQGIFVTPSKMEAQSYAGSNQIYSKEVNLDDVAWIDEIQGQYANINEQNITDNQGRTLSPQQQEYFKDSKVRDENGNLLEVYHGTNNDFNEFDSTKFGKYTGKLKGIWLTDKIINANAYGNNIIQSYVNITNPGSATEVTMTKEQYSKLLKNAEVKESNINSSWEYFKDKNDFDILTHIQRLYENKGKTLQEFYNDVINDTGIDGIYDKEYLADGSPIWIAFNSNQVKKISNITPTDNPDIRYSDNANFDEYIQNRVGKQGTRTTLGELKLPVQQQTQLNNLTEAEAPKQELPTKTENTDEKIAEVLDKPFKEQKPKQRTWAIIKANLVDKGAVFEDLSRKTNNRELQAKWDATLSSGARGQYAIGQDRYEFKDGKRNKISKSLESIISEVGENEADFQNYMYHQLNVDRMTLDQRYGIDNKPVFGDSISAEYSRRKIADLEQEHPEFKEYAQDVYDFLNANKQAMVDSGIISQELSDELAKRYPHYVPIQRVGVEGAAITVPLDTKRTGVNAPLKRAKGGSQDIQPLFNTIADRTLQTYRAGARNSFGVELKNSLQQLNLLNQNAENIDIDNVLDSVATDDTELLKKGEKGKNPTFTVFENGNKVTYDINDDMYDALKPKNELLRKLDDSKLSKAIRKFGDFRRGLLTEYNPIFSITNSLKDAPDVLMHSQHAIKTYKKFPEAYSQILGKGYYYQEYLQNGGEQNSYFNEGDFKIKEKGSKLDKLKMPLEMISKVNNVIEMAPRLAEYIASRESGRSVETSMLDAARVTTNFKAGGDVTKFANRNGATFLNAGVQGLAQNIRDIQEAHQKGFKGYAILAGKLAVAGLPTLILNHLIWRDDEDYEELQDYVKDNYYIIGKYGNGQFIRIPKGRTVAVVQKIVNNIDNFITNDKLDADKYASQFWKDLKEDIKFGVDNLAPNNPIDNNIISPIIQAATNKTWYGEDLVPTRLQDKPKAEQYDESTDKFSKWLGEKTGISPVKINYLLDQYTGGVGDILLPMGTPQAENNAIEDKFTTNSVMKSRYPGEFFEKFDELNVQNNSEKATDEDKVRYKYFSGVREQTSDLYKQKRDIQNSDKSDEEKKRELLEVQKQINKLTKDALEGLDKVKVSGNTATVGNEKYYKSIKASDGKTYWYKVTDEEKQKNKGIALSTYADFKNKIANETIQQRKKGNIDEDGQLKAKDKMLLLEKSSYSDKEKSAIYKEYINQKDDFYDSIESTGININEYLKYKTQEFESDKEDDGTEKGKTVSGSKKNKVVDYIKNMNISYNQKLLLLGSQYSLSNSEKKTLANYVNNLNIGKEEKLNIYRKLTGFTVYKDGRVKY